MGCTPGASRATDMYASGMKRFAARAIRIVAASIRAVFSTFGVGPVCEWPAAMTSRFRLDPQFCPNDYLVEALRGLAPLRTVLGSATGCRSRRPSPRRWSPPAVAGHARRPFGPTVESLDGDGRVVTAVGELSAGACGAIECSSRCSSAGRAGPGTNPTFGSRTAGRRWLRWRSARAFADLRAGTLSSPRDRGSNG